MKKALAILLAVILVVSVTATAVNAEPVTIKEKKIVSMDTNDGQITGAKGVENKETGDYWDEFGSGQDASDIGFPQIY